MTPGLDSLARTPWVTSWGADGWSFNLPSDASDEDEGDPASDGSGLPGRDLVGCAMRRWSDASPDADAALAAAVFNLPRPLADDVFRAPGFDASDLTDAVMVWSSCVGASVPVDMAAIVFGTSVADVLAAVDGHYWMYVERVGGVSCIGHEGE